MVYNSVIQKKMHCSNLDQVKIIKKDPILTNIPRTMEHDNYLFKKNERPFFWTAPLKMK